MSERAHSRLYMDAVITPNRSLSKQGLAVLMSGLAIYNVLLAIVMTLIGAFPIPVFLGLDLLALAIAFHISNRRATRAERVQVSAEAVTVIRQEAPIWTSPTAFTRVVIDADDEEPEVQLRLSGRSLTVAGWLSPKERRDFASALERAILKAQSERYAPA